MQVDTAEVDALARFLDAAAVRIHPQSVALVTKHTMTAAQLLRSTSPSRRVAESVETSFSHGGLQGQAQPTHRLTAIIAYGTGPRVQRTTGRYTGVMPPNDFITPVQTRVAEAFEREMLNLAVRAVQ